MVSKYRKSFLFYPIWIFVFLVLTITPLQLTQGRHSGNEESPYLDIQHLQGDKVGIWVQVPKMNLKKEKGEKIDNNVWEIRTSGPTRRLLGGPGSSPPRCTAKCGRCSPCKPVHVPVPPGTPVTTEYYPEAWRCKCGNKLYMP